MSLDNNSANNFKDFLDAIKPYLNYQPVDMSVLSNESNILSTTEKAVGQTSDGYLIYQKYIPITRKRASWSQQYSAIITLTASEYNISNLGKLMGAYAFCDGWDSANGKSGVFHCGANMAPSSTDIIITLLDSMGVYAVMLRYTKTTDSPLSADEKFAGVTSGGEVIYEKTVSFTNKGSNSPMLEFDSGISIVDYCGFMENNNDKLSIVGYYWNSSEYCSSYVTNSGEKIRLSTSFSGKNVTVTIRYTKTQ